MLKVSDVYAGYGGIDVIRKISFEIESGQNLSIIGPNGCGKTTLLKAVAGLLDYRGEVSVAKTNIAGLSPKILASKIALLSQISSVYFSYSVYDTVMMGRYLYINSLLGVPSKKDKDYVDFCLKMVNLYEQRNRNIKNLSGGQLQRVFLARVLAQDPKIILLDEPTNHLDLKYQFELIDYLKNWAKEQNRTILGVLHDINLAVRLSDNILLMKDGEIAALGKACDVLGKDVLKDVYEIDVVAAMLKSLRIWEDLSKNDNYSV